MSTPNWPDVTVIISAFGISEADGGRSLHAALHSVFAQTHDAFEVIVVGDGSVTDPTALVAGWGPRLAYVHRPIGAQQRARNDAIARGRGRFTAFLCPGHVWLPRKLERAVIYFRQHADTGLLHTAAIVGRNPVTAALETEDADPLDLAGDPPINAFADLFHGNVEILTSTAIAPTRVIRECGGFDERCDVQVQDWDLWLRIAAQRPVGYLAMPLAAARPAQRRVDVETTYRAQERVIEKMSAVCATACERHRGSPDACLRECRHRLYLQLGDQRLRDGRTADARTAYAGALNMRPTDLRSYTCYAASLAGQWCAKHLLPSTRTLSSRRASLIEATIYQRTRRVLAQTVHAADDLVYRIGRAECHVLFQAASPMSLAVARPVLERLQSDPRIALWFTSADASWDANRIFGAAGLTGRVVSATDARWMKLDAYLNTDFWNMTWPLRRTRRVHMFHGVAGKYGLDAPVCIAPIVASFDRLMFPNRDRLARYAEAGLVDPDGERAVLVGYPKVDCLVDGSLNRAAIEESMGLDPTLPTVLYAPTWSPYASLSIMGLDILTALARLDANVIVKLHDRSHDRTNGSGGIDWRGRLERLASDYPNVHVALEADASPYLFVSDALVTDHSSVGFEFMLLNRPIVVIDCRELLNKAGVNPEKARQLRSAAHVVDLARGANAVIVTVTRALVNPERFGQERRAIAEQLFFRPGSASARAVQCVYDLLALSVPEPAPKTEHGQRTQRCEQVIDLALAFSTRERS